MDYVEVFTNAFNKLLVELVNLIPQLLVALIIWYIGVYLLNFVTKLLNKVDIKTTDLDDKAIKTINLLIIWVGRFLLALIILDYLGVGSTVVGAVANGLTFAIAIALGIAFGDALKPEAKRWVNRTKKFITK